VIDNVHSTMTRPSRLPLSQMCHKQTDDVELCISPVYRRLAVAKFSKSTSRNCSRDPDHAPFREDFSSVGWDLL